MFECRDFPAICCNNASESDLQSPSGRSVLRPETRRRSPRPAWQSAVPDRRQYLVDRSLRGHRRTVDGGSGDIAAGPGRSRRMTPETVRPSPGAQSPGTRDAGRGGSVWPMPAPTAGPSVSAGKGAPSW